MTLLAPVFLGLAALAATATVVLHLLALRRPPEYTLPTARFVPEGSVRATAMARVPTDLLLLGLRMAALLLMGLALARPIFQPERTDVRRVLLVDRSAAVADDGSAEARVSEIARAGDLLLQFGDSILEPVVVDNGESVELAQLSHSLGNLTSALIAGERLAAALGDSAETVELILVSPLVEDQWDAGTLAARDMWPGAVQIERLRAATPDSARYAVAVQTASSGTGSPSGAGIADDAVAAGAELAGAVAPVRTQVIRGASSAEPPDASVLQVYWPESGVPDGWEERSVRDTVAAVVAWKPGVSNAVEGRTVLVGPFERVSMAPGQAARGEAGADGQDHLEGQAHYSGGTTAIAWWSDGEVAAVQRNIGDSCVREVGIALPHGDITLRPAFARFLAALAAPCSGRAADMTPVPDALLLPFESGSGAAVAVERSSPGHTSAAPLVPWLLAGALALLAGEWLVRRRTKRPAEVIA